MQSGHAALFTSNERAVFVLLELADKTAWLETLIKLQLDEAFEHVQLERLFAKRQ